MVREATIVPLVIVVIGPNVWSGQVEKCTLDGQFRLLKALDTILNLLAVKLFTRDQEESPFPLLGDAEVGCIKNQPLNEIPASGECVLEPGQAIRVFPAKHR
jgi:hypothetical protein